MKLLDLFSGIGGFSLGLERAGFKTVAFCEVSSVCRHLLNHHWPEVPAYDDIRTLTAERLAADGITVDAICGGFPCQDISFAGLGAGMEGERSGLWRDYARLIGELRPRLVFVENVAALLGRGLGVVLGDLAALGYDAWWDCIPAAAVGAPHRRDRLWLIAYARGQQHEGYGDALRREVAAELPGGMASSQSPGVRPRLRQPSAPRQRDQPRDDGCVVSHAASERCPQARVDRSFKSTKRVERCRRPVSFGWLSEPNVGRVAHGVPAILDGANVAIQEHDQEAGAQSHGNRGDMLGLRSDGPAAATPPGLFEAGRGGGALPSLPCEGGSAGRGAKGEGDEGLHDLRSRVPADAQQEAHDLQPGMSGRGWASERAPSLGWGQEPDVGRVAHGVPNRVDRLHGLGNAVVPQIPEILGRAALAAIRANRQAA